jgi:predicted PurR-regulated permease PerM
VEFAFAWGLLAFVLNFIPTVGSIVASIPPVLMALVQFAPSIWPAVGVVLVLLVIQNTLGNFIAPKVYGDRLNLSPVVILLFLLFWGWLWGIVGALLAVPLAAAIQIALAQIPALAPLAVMMGSGQRYARRNKRPSPAPVTTANPENPAE